MTFSTHINGNQRILMAVMFDCQAPIISYNLRSYPLVIESCNHHNIIFDTCISKPHQMSKTFHDNNCKLLSL